MAANKSSAYLYFSNDVCQTKTQTNLILFQSIKRTSIKRTLVYSYNESDA